VIVKPIASPWVPGLKRPSVIVHFVEEPTPPTRNGIDVDMAAGWERLNEVGGDA
jgi:hypothetical protein